MTLLEDLQRGVRTFSNSLSSRFQEVFFQSIQEKEYSTKPLKPIIMIWNKNERGEITSNYSAKVTSTILYHSYTNGTPSTVECSILNDHSIQLNIGDLLTLTTSEIQYFKGMITKIQMTKDADGTEEYSIIAQDQLIYFKNSKDSLSYQNITLKELLSQILDRLQLSKEYHLQYSSSCEDLLPATNEINKTYAQMMKNAMETYLLLHQQQNQFYLLLDRFGKMVLKSNLDLRTNYRIRAVQSYTYTREINDQTITKVKFEFKNPQTWNNTTFRNMEYVNNTTLPKWGVFQYYEPQSNYSIPMTQKIATLKFLRYGKERQHYQFHQIIPNEKSLLFAGCSFQLRYETQPKVWEESWYFITECIHRWERKQHTMDLMVRNR